MKLRDSLPILFRNRSIWKVPCVAYCNGEEADSDR